MIGKGISYDERPPEAPSFEPWLARVRMIRSWLAGMTFVLVAGQAYRSGMPADDAILRGMVSSVAAYFVGWGSALWLCSELYFVQVGRIRRRLEQHHRDRAAQLNEIYRQRSGAADEDMGQQRPAA